MTGLFTRAARPHIRRLLRALARPARGLERRLNLELNRQGWNSAQVGALLAVTPTACARLSSLGCFVRQVDENGRRLAKLNIGPEDALKALEQFGMRIDRALQGRYEPAREQLHLATRLVLDRAYYQVREAESQALLALSQAEVESPDLDHLLRSFVEVLVRTFGAAAGWLILMEPGVSGKTPQPRYFGKAGRYGSIWSYPLGPRSVLQLAFTNPRVWLPGEQALLEAAAVHCQEALERARLEGEIRRLEAEAHRAEEEERRRIGRELHDEAGQALMALRLQLEMLEREAPAHLRRRLAEAREVAGRTAVELRRIVAALSPAVLERLGLEAALRHLVTRFQKIHAGRVRLRIRMGEQPLPRPVAEVIYRATQECLHNIARHSQATAVNLRLHAADKNIELSVTDNGSGFRADQVAGKSSSFGLAGMRQRARLLGGTLEISSRPGKGTRIRLQVPRDIALVVGNGKDSRTVNG
ncbi:MAG TPA: sensor histidine kinase [Bryobacteraceae bacterium]